MNCSFQKHRHKSYRGYVYHGSLHQNAMNNHICLISKEDLGDTKPMLLDDFSKASKIKEPVIFTTLNQSFSVNQK